MSRRLAQVQEEAARPHLCTAVLPGCASIASGRQQPDEVAGHSSTQVVAERIDTSILTSQRMRSGGMQGVWASVTESWLGASGT
jgi:hypothetical protein